MFIPGRALVASATAVGCGAAAALAVASVLALGYAVIPGMALSLVAVASVRVNPRLAVHDGALNPADDRRTWP